MRRWLSTVFICSVFISVSNAQDGFHSINLSGRVISDDKLISELIGICYAGEVKYSDITSLKSFSKDGIIYILGEIDSGLPEVIYKSFVIFSSVKKVFILDLSFAEVLEKSNSGTYLLGGIHQYRGIGHYYVYSVGNDTCSLLFKSGTPVFNTSLGCDSFKDAKLELTYKDLNNDGCKDLSFVGTRFVYCEDAQSNRIDDQVVRTEEVFFCYLFDRKTKHFVKCSP